MRPSAPAWYGVDLCANVDACFSNVYIFVYMVPLTYLELYKAQKFQPSGNHNLGRDAHTFWQVGHIIPLTLC